MTDQLPTITITYCPGCNWMFRSSWMCQELLHSFGEHIHGVTLVPSKHTPGIFEIHIEEQLVWNRKTDGGFPSATDLKQRVRDIIDPDRDLGHHDKK